MNLLALIPAAWRLRALGAVTLAVLAGATVFYFSVKHEAFNEGYAKANLRWELELAKVQAANNKVVEDAQIEYRADLEVLELNKDKINDLLVENAGAAARDPDAGSLGIGADSVHRLNAIR